MRKKVRLVFLIIFYFCLTNSPMVNLLYSGLSNYIIIFIFGFAFFDLFSSSTKKTYFIFFIFSFLGLFVLFQYLFLDNEVIQLQLGLYRLLILPLVAYYSVWLNRRGFFNLIDFLLPVVVICIFVVYWRVFVDYSFFGLISFADSTSVDDLYKFGAEFWRPSSLESPIIFSIELALFVFYYYRENTIIKNGNVKSLLFVLITIVPFLVMRSRSAFIILLGTSLLYFFRNDFRFYKLIYVFFFILLISPFFKYIGFDSILFLTDESLSDRSNSLSNSLNGFVASSFKNIILGFGSGHSNFELNENSGFNIYVENYFASFLIDYGFVLTFLFLIFNAYLFIVGLISAGNIVKLSVPFFILVNFFSSNLTAYSLQFLYWLLIFEIYFLKKSRPIDQGYQLRIA